MFGFLHKLGEYIIVCGFHRLRKSVHDFVNHAKLLELLATSGCGNMYLHAIANTVTETKGIIAQSIVQCSFSGVLVTSRCTPKSHQIQIFGVHQGVTKRTQSDFSTSTSSICLYPWSSFGHFLECSNYAN